MSKPTLGETLRREIDDLPETLQLQMLFLVRLLRRGMNDPGGTERRFKEAVARAQRAAVEASSAQDQALS